jgi:hypothetical protein
MKTYSDLLNVTKRRFRADIIRAQELDVEIVLLSNIKKDMCYHMNESVRWADSTIFLPERLIKCTLKLLNDYKLHIDVISSLKKCDTLTTVESSLSGKFLEDMIHLNDYIFTTSSTKNLQHDKMYIGFYTLNSIARLLVPHIGKLGYLHFIVYNEHKKTVLAAHCRIACIKTITSEFPDQLREFQHLLEAEDPLVYVYIEDKRDDRTLYSMLRGFLK